MFHSTQAGTAASRFWRPLAGSLLMLELFTGSALAQSPCPTPVFNNAPTSITRYTDANSCSVAALYAARTLDSLTDVLTYRLSGATLDSGLGIGSGAVFNRGITHVTLTATNSCGSSTHGFDLTILDSVRPQILGMQNITVNVSPNQCGAVVNYAKPTATDNCTDCSSSLLTSLGFIPFGTFGGHSYYLTPGIGAWARADSFANNIGAYLVAINSAAEDAFIDANMPDTESAWLGFTDRDQEGVWKWTNGDPVTYTNWCDGQPDDWQGDQDYALINSLGVFGPDGCWDDGHAVAIPSNGALNRYPGIIEIESCNTDLVRIAGLDSGSFFPLGTTVVTYKATDGSGNETIRSFTVTVLDNIAPGITCPADVVLACNSADTSAQTNGSATANDNCTANPVVTHLDSIFLNTIYRIWKATDASGNSTTCIQKISRSTGVGGGNCSIAVSVSDPTYTGGVNTNIYLGYGPQSATLTASSAGGGTKTYSWSGPTSTLSCTNCPNPVFTPTTGGIYTFTVTISSATACATTCTVTFCVKDIRVPANCCHSNPNACNDNTPKVYVCHRPPGNPNNTQTLCLPVSAIPAHIGPRGHANDFLGKCDQVCGNTARYVGEPANAIGTEVRVFPNPATNTFFLELPFFELEASVTLMDIQGKVLQTRTVNEADDHKLRFDLGNDSPRGVYMVDVKYDDHRYRTKVVLQ